MITVGALRCNWVKHLSVSVHCRRTHGVHYTQIPGVPTLFPKHSTRNHRNFSVFQLAGFEITPRKTQQNVTSSGEFYAGLSKTAPKGWHMPELLQSLFMWGGRPIAPTWVLSSKHPIYMASYPWNLGSQQTLHTLWHHLWGYFRPSVMPCYNMSGGTETLTKSCADCNSVMLCKAQLLHSSAPQLF